MTQTSPKTYVLDTNVLLSDPNSIYSFQEHTVIIPLIVLEELDRHKGRQDEVGRNARHVAREFDSLRALGNLGKGVKLDRGSATGVLKIMDTGTSSENPMLPGDLLGDKADNKIIGLAFLLHKHALKKDVVGKVVLVSKDINVRVKCDAIEMPCEDYLHMRVKTSEQGIYSGVKVLQVSQDTLRDFYTNGKSLKIDETTFPDTHFYTNQFVVLKDESGQSSSAITRVHCSDGVNMHLRAISDRSAFALAPKNKEQRFALDVLMDPKVKLVTMLGPAGCGKTLLACAAGLEQTKGLGGQTDASYNRLIITRTILPLGKDIGFLPGTLEEKMSPWIAPLKDNLNFLYGNKSGDKDPDSLLSLHFEKKKIEVEAITFIRGRSIPKAFMIIDEAQNLSMHELKTIITRVGEDTKIVLTGDIEQIDNTYVDAYTNGLTYAVEKFKESSLAAHISLLKGERSDLATLASKIL